MLTFNRGASGVSYKYARTLDAEAQVHEIHWGETDPQVVANIMNAHFSDCDMVMSKDGFWLPKLFVSDMDSTMIGQECIDELADFAGLKAQISEITERAMQGELDFTSALNERVALLKGLDEGAIQRCLDECITPTPGAEVLTRTLKAKGCRTVLVTGGFHHFADRVAEWLGFDRVVGNRLGVADGKLTGKLDGPISDASTKLAVLQEEAARLGARAYPVATGDGANDIPMIEAATYGFAYRAKPKARAAANGRIDHGDLTNILSLLGIPRKDWVEG
ncbi:phosphoserine phosphatase SerB [uncultured Erythrobacter sp.]|uniref:phosphoserine phosphatase SerB n=1 Tax=uncultured Erythrobacter sp. TaxID=263913 RepID=UPI0026343971|nr:phosphoserine phosphatase SerB [uncultured Erythrobacter sp.]